MGLQMSENLLIALNDTEAFKPAGLPYKKSNQLRWLHRHRKQNGFDDAFVLIGGRIFLDVPKFHQIARSRPSAA
jgi:hypothetical protein